MTSLCRLLLQSEAAQRLDDLEKLIDEHQEIVEELKRTESSQVSTCAKKSSRVIKSHALLGDTYLPVLVS